MAYNIHNISSIAVEDFPFYYCDANVWIANLRYIPLDYEEPYQTFIKGIVSLNNITEPKIVKKIKNKPKIVLTSLVLSEVINSYMRIVAMKSFFGGDDEYRNHDFKKEYRDNPLSDYVSQLNNLSSDISAFSDYTVLYNDSFEKIEPFSIITDLSSSPMDFNDLYYCRLFKDKGIPIVTHDRDFRCEDIDIITSNRELLRYSTV